MKDIYSKEGFVKTYLEGRIISVIWEKLYDADEIYASCKPQLELVKNNKADVIIIDVSNASGTPPVECQEWFGNVLFPGYSENPNFKALINVIPKSSVTKMGANRWKKTAENNFGFSVYETDSLEVAKSLAKTL